jgi:hypothetical protein
MTDLKTEAGVFSDSLAPAPGPGDVGESIARSPNSGEDRVASPSARAGSAAAIVVGDQHRADDGGRESVVAGEYPVPGRTPEYNRRVAGHEIGHAFLARALGSSVSFVTIARGEGYEGRCVRTGYKPSSLNLDVNPEAETSEIVDVCARLEKMAPEIGTARVESSEVYLRAQTLCIELVGGRVCEEILFPDHQPLHAEHDQIEARAFAAVACAAPRAVGALLAYAEAEATALLIANLGIVRALVGAILETGSLSGDEVDTVIRQTMAMEAAELESRRRLDWQQRQASAARFVDQQKLAGDGRASMCDSVGYRG